MKTIIPVAGVGIRLRPHTLTKPKVLLNVAGKPMIHHIIEQLIRENITTQIIFITGYLGNKIEKYIRHTFKFNFKFIVQKEPLGLGHAIHCAKSAFRKKDEVLIILGDTLFDVNLNQLCDNKHSVIGVKKVKDPKRFGVVEKNKKGFITRMVEKPATKQVSTSNSAIVGLYYLKNSDSLFNALDYTINKNIKVNNEYQLTSALEKMLLDKEKMVTYYVNGWLDCGKPETVLETNRYLLNKSKKNYSFKGNIIKYPVSIGKNVIIKNSIIGPYATISDKCKIMNSIISNSIIDKNTKIENKIIKDSIIGENAVINGYEESYNIGDYTIV